MKDLNKKISDKLEDVKEFVSSPEAKEKANEFLGKVKDEATQIMKVTMDKISEVKESDTVKEFIGNVADRIDDTIQTVCESNTIYKVKDKVSDTYETIKNDESLQSGIAKAKKTTLSIARKALSGIEKILDDEDKVVVHEVDVENKVDE